MMSWGEPAERSLTVGIGGGLGNRLRPLLSGLTLAEASQRRFTMLWPRDKHCAASFRDLFVNEWPVQEVKLEVVYSLPACCSLPDILIAAEPHLSLRTARWLLSPTRYRHHAAYVPRCEALLAGL